MKATNMSGRQAHRYTLDGTYVDSFNSLTEAHKATGVNIGYLSSHLYGEKASAGGYLWSEDKVDAMKPYKRNARQVKEFRIHQYSFDGKYIREFNNYKEIAEALNINIKQAQKVKRCCDGKAYHAFDYQWKYTKAKKISGVTGVRSSREVLQFDSNNKLVARYSSPKEAWEVGLKGQGSPKSMSHCLNGRMKTFKGYKWCYAN